MELYPLSLSQLHFVESGEFIVRFLTDFEKQGHDITQDLEIKYFYDTLKAKSPQFNKSLLPIKAKAESQELAALDIARDRKISTLTRAYNVFEHTDSTAEQQAYWYLAPLFTTYSNVARMNFEAQSLAVDNMVEDLNSARYKTHADALLLGQHVARVFEANEAFKAKFNDRSARSIEEEDLNAKQLRNEIFEVYNEAADYVQVMAKRKKTAYYQDILRTLNDGREYYANILARRNGGNDTAPEA